MIDQPGRNAREIETLRQTRSQVLQIAPFRGSMQPMPNNGWSVPLVTPRCKIVNNYFVCGSQ